MLPRPTGDGRPSADSSTRAPRAVEWIRSWFTMPEACSVCGLRFERAQGYFVGAIYVNYAVTVVLTTLAGGLWPAIRAARLRPMEAVRHV